MATTRSKAAAVLPLLLAAVLFFGAVVPVLAEETGEILVRCSVERDGRTIYLSGDEFTLVRVASAQEVREGGVSSLIFSTMPEYSGYDCDWSSLNAEETKARAAALAEAIGSDPMGIASGYTDGKGEVLLSGLPAGVYLLLRTYIADNNADYIEEPILVVMPQITMQWVSYNVTAEPKIRWGDLPGPTDVPEEPTPTEVTEKPTPTEVPERTTPTVKPGKTTPGAATVQPGKATPTPAGTTSPRTAGTVKTGDEENPVLYLAVLLSSAMILVWLATGHRKKG